MSITIVTYTSLVVLSVFSIALQYVSNKSNKSQESLSNPQYVKFKHRYYLVYFFTLFADWLQGPYVYKLYSHYGFAEEQIAILYVVGFGASIVFGTGTGALADRVGRKRMSIMFCILYSLCCFTKLSPNFWILCIGRILGGISTSLLFSTFESWYVCEHIERYDFPTEWISVMFSEATFWNGILAIVAGIVSNVLSEWLNFGPVSPFMMAIPFLITACIIITKTWSENYGKSDQNYSRSCMEALRIIFTDETIMLLGIIQSLFECVMYLFVFLWTPILEPLQPQIGLLFSCFMLCIMMGSCLYQICTDYNIKPERMLLTAVILSLTSMMICILSTSPSEPLPYLSYAAFLLLEVSVGIYFPAIGYLRSLIIPEKHRSSMLNWFRVPMNTFTCIGLMFLHSDDTSRGNQFIFLICTLLTSLAVLFNCRLNRILPKYSLDQNSV